MQDVTNEELRRTIDNIESKLYETFHNLTERLKINGMLDIGCLTEQHELLNRIIHTTKELIVQIEIQKEKDYYLNIDDDYRGDET